MSHGYSQQYTLHNKTFHTYSYILNTLFETINRMTAYSKAVSIHESIQQSCPKQRTPSSTAALPLSYAGLQSESHLLSAYVHG